MHLMPRRQNNTGQNRRHQCPQLCKCGLRDDKMVQQRQEIDQQPAAQSWLSQVRWQHPTEQFWQSLPVIEREKIMLSYKSNDNSPEIIKPEMVSNAVRQYIELKSKLNLLPKTMQQIRWKLGMLDHYFGTYHCHQLTTEMLETWFADRE